MLAHHRSQQSASRPYGSPVLSFRRKGFQAYESVQLRESRDDLRARKKAARDAFGFRAGGEPLKVIADAFGVSTSRAHELLSDAYRDDITETYLRRLDGTRFAHVAERVRSVKLGIGAPAARAA